MLAPGQSGGREAGGKAAGADWPVYLGDKGTTHYSTLDQINKDNVARLKVAWTYDTGDVGEFQSNALVIDGVLYTASPNRKVIALNAATGKEIWTFDPTTERPGDPGRRQRGLTYWASGEDRRIFTGVGPYLYALNAATGKLIRSFGQNGSVLLGAGVEVHNQDGPPSVMINTPGVIYRDLYIVGGLTSGPGTITCAAVN
jgi:quinoprotein glucose dehydrogenase